MKKLFSNIYRLRNLKTVYQKETTFKLFIKIKKMHLAKLINRPIMTMRRKQGYLQLSGWTAQLPVYSMYEEISDWLCHEMQRCD